MDETPLFKFSNIKGINNIEDNAYRFAISATGAINQPVFFMKEIENLDVDNSFMLSSRPGFSNKVSGSNVHSLWSDGSLAFFVDGTTLYELLPGWGTTSLHSNINGRLSYVSFNERVYMSNGLDFIGYYLSGSISTLSKPAIEFKSPLPPGSHLAVHYNSLLIASGSTLFISDSLCDFFDVRYGYRAFSSDISMVLPVKGGIYVSDQNDVWFVQGAIHEEYKRLKVSESMAIPGTGILVDSSKMSGIDGAGIVAIWASSSGIFIGDENGNVKNLTGASYTVGDFCLGSAAIRTVSGVSHYLVSLA